MSSLTLYSPVSVVSWLCLLPTSITLYDQRMEGSNMRYFPSKEFPHCDFMTSETSSQSYQHFDSVKSFLSAFWLFQVFPPIFYLEFSSGEWKDLNMHGYKLCYIPPIERQCQWTWACFWPLGPIEYKGRDTMWFAEWVHKNPWSSHFAKHWLLESWVAPWEVWLP